MISYLIYSTICLGLVLLFYHAVLAREKIYQINRGYLLVGLLFSLTVPFMPFGIADSLLTLGSNTEISQILPGGIENTNAKSVHQVTDNPTEENSASHTSYVEWITPFIFWVYGIVTLILSIRMIRHFYCMQLKSMKNPATSFKGHKVVLVDKEVVPHTFWKTIFVNKEQYENKEISEEVMIHELIHAEQNHSLDILIVEILKTIWWFNPVLYFYKKAIQVNHEYIADDEVLSNGTDIADYQTLLLKMRTAKSAHYLSTSLNFNITKKRFQMMTLSHSTYRSSLKLALIIPFFVLLGITFGCEPASMESDNQIEDIVSVEIVDAETIKLNGETVSASQFESAFSELSINPDQIIIDFEVHENVPTGLVTDVQKILRENGTLRINYSTVQSNDSQPREAWSPRPDSRNVLSILINEAGQLLINKEPATLS
ncbi:M56 family metallopeptidase [Aliifodinibius salicampi]|uniref:M56 family metallopeptidase n=1 Tax=Fodinibius salicampi TaxID=1920655 RepID=A0ABT3PUQ6_9BACT|nr:M56 family metallopeptidase [Fodinibius salicampi]MCW9711573.1 M56 family metallopeptidase [Fodinibius salicampi]